MSNPLERRLAEAAHTLEALGHRLAEAPGDMRGVAAAALEDVSVVREELTIASQELQEQTQELVEARADLEAERRRYAELLARALAAGEVVGDEEADIPRSDGTMGALAINAAPVRNAEGKIEAGVVAFSDITYRRWAEEELHQYQEHLEELIEERTQQLEETANQLAEQYAFSEAILGTAATLIIVLDSEGRIVRFNRACEETTGYCFEEVQGRLFWDFLLLPEETEQVRGKWQELVNNLANRSENHWVTRRGERRLISFNNTVLVGPDGPVEYVIASGLDVTEHRALERAMEQAGAYNRSLIEASLDPLVTIAPDGRITDVNTATERYTGRPREELVGTDFSRYFTEPERAAAGYQQVLRDGHVADYRLDLLHSDGHATPVSYNATVYRDAQGEVVGVFAAAHDVTARLRAEEVVRTANAYNRSLIEASPDPLVTIAPDGRITDVNSATERYTGRPREELVGTDFSGYFTEPDRAAAGYQQVLRDGHVADYRLDLLHQDAHATPVMYNATVYRDAQGEVVGVFAAARDITARLLAEEVERRANAYNRSLIEVSLDPLVTIAPDGKITDVNTATERVTGLSREDLIGTDFTGYFTDPERARAGYEQVFRNGQVPDYQLEMVHQDGHITPVVYNAAVYREEGGEVVGVFAAARDITRQRQMEDALRASEGRYRSLVEEANVVLLNTDAEGIITYMNPYALRFFGYSEEEVAGRSVLETILPPQESTGRDMVQMAGEILHNISEHGYSETENVTKDGRRMWMAWSNQPLYDAERQAVGLLAIGVDRTAQKQAEEMLHSYRESLRSLASELALAEERERRRIAVGIHDHVSQTLALCKMRLGSLHRSSLGLSWDQPLAEVEGLVDQVISHTRNLTFELSPPILYELGLNPALEWMCEVTTAQYGLPCYFSGTDDPLQLAEDLRVVLFQGVRELLANAAKHAQATGVTVEIKREGHQVHITVEDDGVGFDAGSLGRAVGDSQSFGLFNVRERLQYLGGQVEIESTPGQGTRVTLTAPLPGQE